MYKHHKRAMIAYMIIFGAMIAWYVAFDLVDDLCIIFGYPCY